LPVGSALSIVWPGDLVARLRVEWMSEQKQRHGPLRGELWDSFERALRAN